MSQPYPVIRETFSAMRRDAKARHRDIAEKLGISEGTLIAAHAGIASGDGGSMLRAIRLRPQWHEIIQALEPLGEVMALTRNAYCVHEKVGVYRKASRDGHVGLVLGGEIDLRLFYAHWTHGFAVTELIDKGVQQSLQFFDVTGIAIHKIFLKPQSDAQAYENLVANFAHQNQQAAQIATALTPAAADQADETIDMEEFRAAWGSLRDIHGFSGLLKKFGVSHTQGLRLADPVYAQRVEAGSIHQMLHAAAGEAVPIMVFVGNPGAIQIHTGVVRKVAVTGPWVNVLDPGFNLHLREDHIASAWVVHRPMADGWVTALEVFDQRGETIATFFGARKPGSPERREWRALIENLLKAPSPCAA